jgi:protein-disulfide isomerase
MWAGTARGDSLRRGMPALRQAEAPMNPPPSPRLKVAVTELDHVLGPADAPVEVVEYGDFECPHCGRAAVVVTRLRAELGDRFKYVFRHFPLSKMHPHARKAAEAAEAAGASGKFWEMHDLLFANPSALTIADLVRYGDQLGVDIAADLAADTWSPRVREDLSSGVRSGVNGTPSFFIDGVRHNGGYDFDSLRAAIMVAST